MAYHAEARDNNTLDGPGVGRSPVYFIEYTTKGEPLSQCNGNGQKINLLQLEKQIIAATTAIEDAVIPQKMPELAAIQRQTKSYADVFKNSYLLASSPPEAQTEFTAAIDSMQGAATALDGLQRAGALSNEDQALQHLYQVTRLLPEMESSMCKGGNCTKVVLQAVEKVKQSQKDQRQQELPKLLNQARNLAAQQKALDSLYRQSQASGQSNAVDRTNSSVASTPKPGQSPSSQSLANGSKPGASARPDDKQPDSQSGGLDQKQQELGKTAAALAAQLRELSGKDPRVGVQVSQKMSEVSGAMAHAANTAHINPANAALDRGFGLSRLGDVIQALQQLLAQDTKSSDMAAEDYPKEYEGLISDYLRSLSYTQ